MAVGFRRLRLGGLAALPCALATLPYLNYQTTSRTSALQAGPGSKRSATASAARGGAIGEPALRADDGPTPGVCRIGYVTDIEGNWQYFDEYVRISAVLERDASRTLRLRDGCELVFGGDVCDKGDGDLYVARELVELKRRYPARVHLILGNRDINKIRWGHELDRPRDDARCVAWWSDVRPTAHSEAQRCRWMLHNTMGSMVPDTFELRRAELAREAAAAAPPPPPSPPPSAVAEEAQLSMLSLGSLLAHLFGGRVDERARAEAAGAAAAAVARGAPPPPPPPPPSDEAVVRSFRESVQPGGALVDYLAAAQIGALLGDCLFVHGALSPACVGVLPPRAGAVPARDTSAAGFASAPSLRAWVDGLNAFAAEEVESFRQFPRGEPGLAAWAEEGGYGGRGGEGLVQYGMGAIPRAQPAADALGGARPKVRPNPTVIYASWFEHGRPAAVAPQVCGYTARAGVRAVFSGHQPIGDAPAVLRARGASAREELVVIVGDTSYSNHVRWMRLPDGALDVAGARLDCSALEPLFPEADGAGAGAAHVLPGGGNRGRAVSEVLIEMDVHTRHSQTAADDGDGDDAAQRPAHERTAAAGAAALEAAARAPGSAVHPTTVRVHGILSEGSTYSYAIALSEAEPRARGAEGASGLDRFVGMNVDGFYVRAPLFGAASAAGPREYVLTKGEGYSFLSIKLTEAQLQSWADARAAESMANPDPAETPLK